MFGLFCSLIVLGIGPLLVRSSNSHLRFRAFLYGFTLIVVSGVCLVILLPQAYQRADLLALGAFFLGVGLPVLLEKSLSKKLHIDPLVLFFIFLGIGLHGLLDGATLNHASSKHQSYESLPLVLAIILHNFPVGLFVWWSLRRHFHWAFPLSILLFIAIMTILGYVGWSTWLSPYISPQHIAIFEALVAGSLLHVVFHEIENDENDENDEKQSPLFWKISGGLLGIFFLSVLYLFMGQHVH
jgi:zinc transporter ZupT